MVEMTLPLVVIALFAGCGISATRATVFAFRRLRPALVRDPEPSRMVFADVAATDRVTWERGLMAATVTDLNHDLAMQVHATARIAAAKHMNGSYAIRSGIRDALPAAIPRYIIASLF